jgi:hypothetical protein
MRVVTNIRIRDEHRPAGSRNGDVAFGHAFRLSKPPTYGEHVIPLLPPNSHAGKAFPHIQPLDVLRPHPRWNYLFFLKKLLNYIKVLYTGKGHWEEDAWPSPQNGVWPGFLKIRRGIC